MTITAKNLRQIAEIRNYRFLWKCQNDFYENAVSDDIKLSYLDGLLNKEKQTITITGKAVEI